MGNGINTPTIKKVFFEIAEGSNYKITDSFMKEEVIEFEQFQKFAQVLFNSDVDFLTINSRILNRRYIYDISPTDEPTNKQKKAREEKAKLKAKKEKEQEEQAQKFRVYQSKWMDKHFPEGWKLPDMMKHMPEIHQDYGKLQ